MTEYRSVEQRIFDEVTKDEDTKNTIRASYGTFASLFRLPTLFRKLSNHQIFALNLPRSSRSRERGTTMFAGGILGFWGGVMYVSTAIIEANQKNYLPLIAVGATNLMSACYEVSRLFGKKQGLEARVEAQ